MEQIEDAIAKLTSNQLNYATVQNHVTAELDELLQWIFAIENNQHSPNSSSSTNPHSPASPSTKNKQ